MNIGTRMVCGSYKTSQHRKQFIISAMELLVLKPLGCKTIQIGNGSSSETANVIARGGVELLNLYQQHIVNDVKISLNSYT